MKDTIFITGITGFLGSQIGKYLCVEGYKVIATKRTESSLKNCTEYIQNIKWVNIDEVNWELEIINLKPQIIIHAAWIGVESSYRNDWILQSKNLIFIQKIFEIAQLSNTKKMIGLGSQAEYGFTNAVVKEIQELFPDSAYGSVKIITSNLLELFCTKNKIEWYWLRVFSVFGEKESPKWLLPSFIKNICDESKNYMDFSLGEQKYAYLFVDDFANAILKVVAHSKGGSGIYNLCSTNLISIKDIITMIKNKIRPSFDLNFGALPYREGQSMLIAGDITKFKTEFGEYEFTSLEIGINKIIDSHKLYFR